jgi:hypothetical protein
LTRVPKGDVVRSLPEQETECASRSWCTSLPWALAIACSDQGPIQNVGPKLTISPATVNVETGADPITLQAVPQNGDLTGSVTWSVLSGAAGVLGPSSGTTVTFAPFDLGTGGGNVVIQATATVGGTLQPATAAVQVVPSTHGRIAMGIDPGGAVGSVDITDPTSWSKVTFVAAGPTVLRSKIIDAGTYLVTADAGIAVSGTIVDGIWDGTVVFDGGTPARSVQVPVRPNQETVVAVTFALRGGLGRLWVPADVAIRSYTENQLLVDRASENVLSVGGARALAFDADGNLWLRSRTGTHVHPGHAGERDGSTGEDGLLNDATGIAIRGDTIAVASCSGNSVSTFSRSNAAATPSPIITVTCPWGISFDGGDTGKLWVASKQAGANGHVFRYPAGGGTAENGVGAAVADAYGIVVDASNPPNVWASSCSGNFIQQVSPTLGSALALPDFACPGGLAFDKLGNLWVVSAGNQSPPVPGNLVQVSGSNGVVQLNSLTQVAFGGLAFNPGAAGLPVHQ